MEKDKNSFKELERLQEDEFVKNLDKVKESLDGNMNSLASLTNFIDLYFSKVLSYIVSMTGGSLDKKEDKEDEHKSQ